MRGGLSLSTSFIALDFAPPAPAGLRAIFAICFLASVYFSRRFTSSSKGLTCSRDFLVGSIVSSCARLLFTHQPRTAARKRARDHAGEVYTFRQALDQIPSDYTTAYTDGSANPNPGPCGAGAFLDIPGHGPVYLYEALGHGTNNLGELWGVGMALQYACSLSPPPTKLVFCTDSMLVHGFLSLNHASRSFPDICSAISSLIARGCFEVRVLWVPGHSGVRGNEVVDRLANMGTLPEQIWGGH